MTSEPTTKNGGAMSHHTLSRRSFLSISALSAAAIALDLNKVQAMTRRIPNKTEYPTVIIGAGLGGLCCGAYLAREGFPVTIIEKHTRPGGYATTFDRAKFTFDVSLHATTIHENTFERTLQNLGLLDTLDVVEASQALRIKSNDIDFSFPRRNTQETIRTMSDLYPDEAQGIKNFMNEMNHIGDEADELSKRGIPFKLIFPVLYWKLFTTRNKTLEDMLNEHLNDPSLKKIIGFAWPLFGGPQPSKISACIYAIAMKNYLTNGIHYIKNGSQALSDALAETIIESGGQILYNTEVKKISVKHGAVSGVTLNNGNTLPARAVVSNADPLNTFHTMLPKDAVPSHYLKELGKYKPGMSTFSIWLGLNRDIREMTGGAYIFQLSDTTPEEDFHIAVSGDINRIPYGITIYDNIYKGYSTPGTTTICIYCFTGYESWRKYEQDYRSGNKQAYYKEKQRWTDILLQRAEKDILPGLTSMIEVTESATPLTNWAYTGNTNGAICGFEQSLGSSLDKRLKNRTPVKGLYLAGAWCTPAGGFSGSMRSGEITFQMMMDDWTG